MTLDDLLRERVSELRCWAASRIDACREQETKFCGAWDFRERHHTGPPQALVEAWTERRSLQAVLGILEGRELGTPQAKPGIETRKAKT